MSIEWENVYDANPCESRNLSHYYEDQPAAIRAVARSMMHRTLTSYFRRNSSIEREPLIPNAEAFEHWLDWATQEDDRKAAERGVHSLEPGAAEG